MCVFVCVCVCVCAHVFPPPQSFTPTLIPALTSIAHDIPRYAEAASGHLPAPTQTAPFHTSIQCTLKSHN